MKKQSILLLVSIIISSTLLAQNSVVKYCSVVTEYSYRGNSRIPKIHADYGSISNFNLIKDSTIVKNLDKVSGFNNPIDVLDYMHELGWELLPFNNMLANNNFQALQQIFYFKKTFKQEDCNHSVLDIFLK